MMEYEKVLSWHSLPKNQTLGGDKINKNVWCEPWNIVMKWHLQACPFVT